MAAARVRRRVEYVEVQCRSALNRVQGMPFEWSLNPYVGCSHACQYCYARAYYALAEHGDGGADFEARILAKVNLPEVLRHELGRPSWRGASVALGTATDCYQPAEGRFRLTRRALDALRDHRNPLGMVTKSPLVYRDLDILADLALMAEVRVFFTITTVDLSLWRLLEPGTANPFKRLWAMQRLVEAGVPAGVLLAPILPGITDSTAALRAVAEAAADHHAAFFGAAALRLKPVVKGHYLDFVGRTFPDLLPRYARAYAGARVHAPADYRQKLEQRVARVRRAFRFTEAHIHRPLGQVVPPPVPTLVRPRGRQMALPDPEGLR